MTIGSIGEIYLTQHLLKEVDRDVVSSIPVRPRVVDEVDVDVVVVCC